VSQLADRFVKDPNDVVQVGQKVSVTVQSIDLARNRIALTMKTGERPAAMPSIAARPRAQQHAQPTAPPPLKPTVTPVQPGKGWVAPNGIRFK
jgi:protein Tex